MKKFLALILCLLCATVTVAFTACNGTETPKGKRDIIVNENGGNNGSSGGDNETVTIPVKS